MRPPHRSFAPAETTDGQLLHPRLTLDRRQVAQAVVSRYVARRRVEIRLERREVSIPQTYMWVFVVRPAPDRFVYQGKSVQLNTFDEKGGQFGPSGQTALLRQRKNLLCRRA